MEQGRTPKAISIDSLYYPCPFRKAQLSLFIIWSVDLSEIKKAGMLECMNARMEEKVKEYKENRFSGSV